MLESKRIIAIIPARGGSKGVPRKNLRKVNGKSLLSLTIETAKLSEYIDRIVVSSEDQEIITEARQIGADVPFVRPSNLAQDDTPGIEPILHGLESLPGYDYVIVLQVTSPLRTVNDIDHALQFCLKNQAKACVSVTETETHPYWTFSLRGDHTLHPLLDGEIPHRRQDLPPIYSLNGCIYIAEVDWLKRSKTFLSRETIGYIMPNERSLDMDTELDFIYLETYLKMNGVNIANNNED